MGGQNQVAAQKSVVKNHKYGIIDEKLKKAWHCLIAGCVRVS
jgi:hypothetical protein